MLKGSITNDGAKCTCPADHWDCPWEHSHVKECRMYEQRKPKVVAALAPPTPRDESGLDRMIRDNQAKKKAGMLSEYLVLLSDIAGGPKTPAAYVRTDGATIIPEGLVSSILGDPSMGKSWLLLEIAIAVARAGHRVLWWDFEDSKETVLERCGVLGFGIGDGLGNIGFIPPAVADDPGLIQQAALWVQQGERAGARGD